MTASANTAKANPSPTTQKVLDALIQHRVITAAELAAATGLGRSTVDNQLAALEQVGDVRRTAGNQNGRRRGANRWALIKPQPLRPGQLNDLVLDYLRNADAPLGPVAIARGLQRSSGAVANCLARLTRAGQLHQVADRPRRYTVAV
jgi:DNA-binding IclR family transcriptional regulator